MKKQFNINRSNRYPYIFIFIGLFFTSLTSCSQNEVKASVTEIDSIVEISNQILLISGKINSLRLENSENSDSLIEWYDDYLVKNNKFMIKLLINKSSILSILDNFVFLKDSTIINVIKSKDENVFVFTWDTGLGYEIPSYASVVYYKSNGTYYSSLLQANEIFEYDIGTNLFFSEICSHDKSNQYILIGTNKCGSICVKNVLNMFHILNNEFNKVKEAFVEKDKFALASSLEFEYWINDKIKEEPHFIVDVTTVKVPIFSEDYSMILKYKKYNITK